MLRDSSGQQNLLGNKRDKKKLSINAEIFRHKNQQINQHQKLRHQKSHTPSFLAFDMMRFADRNFVFWFIFGSSQITKTNKTERGWPIKSEIY
jgi:hypothetical protein